MKLCKRFVQESSFLYSFVFVSLFFSLQGVYYSESQLKFSHGNRKRVLDCDALYISYSI